MSPQSCSTGYPWVSVGWQNPEGVGEETAKAYTMAAIAVHSRKFIMQIAFVLLILYCTFSAGKDSKKGAGKEKDNKIGKDVLDYNERDVHKLLDQWDVRFLKFFQPYVVYVRLLLLILLLPLPLPLPLLLLL